MSDSQMSISSPPPQPSTQSSTINWSLESLPTELLGLIGSRADLNGVIRLFMCGSKILCTKLSSASCRLYVRWNEPKNGGIVFPSLTSQLMGLQGLDLGATAFNEVVRSHLPHALERLECDQFDGSSGADMLSMATQLRYLSFREFRIPPNLRPLDRARLVFKLLSHSDCYIETLKIALELFSDIFTQWRTWSSNDQLDHLTAYVKLICALPPSLTDLTWHETIPSDVLLPSILESPVMHRLTSLCLTRSRTLQRFPAKGNFPNLRSFHYHIQPTQGAALMDPIALEKEARDLFKFGSRLTSLTSLTIPAQISDVAVRFSLPIPAFWKQLTYLRMEDGVVNARFFLPPKLTYLSANFGPKYSLNKLPRMVRTLDLQESEVDCDHFGRLPPQLSMLKIDLGHIFSSSQLAKDFSFPPSLTLITHNSDIECPEEKYLWFISFFPLSLMALYPTQNSSGPGKVVKYYNKKGSFLSWTSVPIALRSGSLKQVRYMSSLWNENPTIDQRVAVLHVALSEAKATFLAWLTTPLPTSTLLASPHLVHAISRKDRLEVFRQVFGSRAAEQNVRLSVEQLLCAIGTFDIPFLDFLHSIELLPRTTWQWPNDLISKLIIQLPGIPAPLVQWLINHGVNSFTKMQDLLTHSLSHPKAPFPAIEKLISLGAEGVPLTISISDLNLQIVAAMRAASSLVGFVPLLEWFLSPSNTLLVTPEGLDLVEIFWAFFTLFRAEVGWHGSRTKKVVPLTYSPKEPFTASTFIWFIEHGVDVMSTLKSDQLNALHAAIMLDSQPLVIALADTNLTRFLSILRWGQYMSEETIQMIAVYAGVQAPRNVQAQSIVFPK